MRAKSFFYVSLGILALALAYHLGANNATAQSGSMVSGFNVGPTGYNALWVLTPNGDVYLRDFGGNSLNDPGAFALSILRYQGNFWSGGPTPAAQPTFGQLKAQYRK